MKKRWLFLPLVILLFFGWTFGVHAAEYSFSLDKEVVQAYWNEDGTLSLDYTFWFHNMEGAHPIDFVDVGLPNENYLYYTISADVDGAPVLISEDYQGSGSGIAVDLGEYAIAPGRKGKVHVYIGEVDDVLYVDSKDDTYASADFAPTWFGEEFVVGTTDLTVVYHMPPGVKPNEPRWHKAPDGFPPEPEIGQDASGRVTYTWRNPVASGSERYLFGASFPASYVPESAVLTPSLFQKLHINEGCCTAICFVAIFFGIPAISIISERKRKMKYLPPKISIEGHGVKRGLTAVEAALLMEEPLDKVMTMILFGVIKKGAAKVVSQKPLKLQVADPLPEGLRPYEVEFLAAFLEKNAARRKRSLQQMMVNLIKSLEKKMRGFSRKETIRYYKSIMERAWKQVEAANTPEVKSEKYAEHLEWTMLDKEYEKRTDEVFRSGPVFVPMWWSSYDPTFSRSGTPSKGISMPSSGSSRSGAALPGSAFAASLVQGTQHFSSSVIGNIRDFTSKVTGTTNPPPVSSGGGGGGGGGCACACAGCACACAGGGR